jgi:hypothetical protein
VNALLENGEAAWCPAVRLSCGAESPPTPNGRHFAATRRSFPATRSPLKSGLGRLDSPIAGGHPGVTVPLADLLIFACAKTHRIEIAHDDAHFDELTSLPGAL